MNKSGIYTIINIENGHRYIGGSRNVYERMTEHKRLLRKNKHHSKYLQRAWNKYGEDKFKFIVLIICDRLLLKLYEQRFLDYYKPDYNISISSDCPTRGRKLSLETRQRMSKSRIGKCFMSREAIEKLRRINIGRKNSAESRKKMGNHWAGRKRPDRQGENCHLSKFKEGEIIAIRVIKKITGISNNKLSKLYGITRSGMNKIINGKTWNYLLEKEI